MDIEAWQELGIVSGALLALSALIGLIYRAVIRPVWRTIKRLNLVADLLLGDKTRSIPSLQERLDQIVATSALHAVATQALEKQLYDHIQWHRDRTGVNGPRPADQPRP